MKFNLISKHFNKIVILQLIIAVYSVSTVMAKLASMHSFLSTWFCFFYFLELMILVVYALLWQQIIKKFELSIAYANRSLTLLWSIIWSIFIFGESITIKNAIGILIVIIGIMVVNSNER